MFLQEHYSHQEDPEQGSSDAPEDLAAAATEVFLREHLDASTREAMS